MNDELTQIEHTMSISVFEKLSKLIPVGVEPNRHDFVEFGRWDGGCDSGGIEHYVDAGLTDGESDFIDELLLDEISEYGFDGAFSTSGEITYHRGGYFCLDGGETDYTEYETAQSWEEDIEISYELISKLISIQVPEGTIERGDNATVESDKELVQTVDLLFIDGEVPADADEVLQKVREEIKSCLEEVENDAVSMQVQMVDDPEEGKHFLRVMVTDLVCKYTTIEGEVTLPHLKTELPDSDMED